MSRRAIASLVFLLAASRWCWAQPTIAPLGADRPANPFGEDASLGSALSPGVFGPADPGLRAPAGEPGMFCDFPGRPSKCTPRCWFTAEYLLWWVKAAPLPAALVTSGRNDVEFSGALGEFGTQVLFGNGSVDFGAQSGARFGGGWWFDPYDTVGVEAGGFFLQQKSNRAGFSSAGAPGDPILGIPFFNTAAGAEDFADISVPGELAGTVEVASSVNYWSAEGNLAFNLYRDRQACLDILGGFRYQQLEENLQITGSSTPLDDSTVFYRGAEFPAPAVTVLSDRFHTRNEFLGGQLGARAEWRCGNASVQLAGTVALGNTHQTVDASGSSALLGGPGGVVNTIPGGLFVQPSNSGRLSDDAFTVIPEGKVTVGYRLTGHLRAFAGYQFTYWSHVVRPGDQINRNVNPTQVPTFAEFALPGGPPAALPFFRTTDFWAHGADFGLELSF